MWTVLVLSAVPRLPAFASTVQQDERGFLRALPHMGLCYTDMLARRTIGAQDHTEVTHVELRWEWIGSGWGGWCGHVHTWCFSSSVTSHESSARAHSDCETRDEGMSEIGGLT